MTLPLPPHFAPSQVADLWVERVSTLAERGPQWAKMHGIAPASRDQKRVAAFGIDCQISFCHPDGGLFVPGAVEDAVRVLHWIYRNLGSLTGLVMSLDTHEMYQIFHPAFWRDASGQPPAPLTAICAADVASRRWVPVRSPELALEYVKRLEESGRYILTIWPYHALLGGLSPALLPAIAEALFFHAFARRTEPFLRVKGRHPMTEMYSALSPEVCTLGGRSTGGFDDELFEHLLTYERVYVFGQASSHCVLATLEDIHERLRGRGREALGRFVILEDAMSPVPAPGLDPLPPELDFPAEARRRLDALVEAGMGRARTTEAIA